LGHHLQRLEHHRQEVLVGVAVRQHEAADAMRVPRDDESGDRTAGVVGDERDVVQVQRGEDVGHDLRESRRGRVGVVGQGPAMRAEWPVRHDQPSPAQVG
jgi:hypothetical protein